MQHFSILPYYLFVLSLTVALFYDLCIKVYFVKKKIFFYLLIADLENKIPYNENKTAHAKKSSNIYVISALPFRVN